LDVSTAKEIIKAAVLADDAVIMQGLHGIGKSAVVKQFAAEENYHLEELFLSHQEVGDLIGNPKTIEKDGVAITTWTIPAWLQRMYIAAQNGQHCVLFLDEINRAPHDVRQSALQLVLERQLHEHILPTVDGQRTMVVSAINPADDYQVDELDPALLDRFLFLQVDVDTKGWLKWARQENVNKIVRDFISEHNDRLHWTPADGEIGATPRSWAKLGGFMDNVDKINEEHLFQIMKGKIGTEIASQFYTFYKNYVDVVKMEDIEKIVNDNKDELEKIEDIAELIAEKMEKTEAIQKSEMAHQLAEKYVEKKDILPWLAYLYSLEVEICVSFLKSYREDNVKGYKKLAKVDGVLNQKELFKRVIKASEKE
jgi:alkaline phosphatase D